MENEESSVRERPKPSRKTARGIADLRTPTQAGLRTIPGGDHDALSLHALQGHRERTIAAIVQLENRLRWRRKELVDFDLRIRRLEARLYRDVDVTAGHLVEETPVEQADSPHIMEGGQPIRLSVSGGSE